VPLEEVRPGMGIGDERSAVTPPCDETEPVVEGDEKAVLEILVACGAGRTMAQLSANSGLERDAVAVALDGLRAKGLVTRFNTLVESYAARFPGIQV